MSETQHDDAPESAVSPAVERVTDLMAALEESVAKAKEARERRIQRQPSDPEVQQATCVCGATIQWRPYPPLPFPEVATEDQRKRQEQGGRWVHPTDGGFDEWCAPRRARPSDTTDSGANPDEPSRALRPEASRGLPRAPKHGA